MFQSITPFLEMVIIAIMLNYLLSLFWNTRTMDVLLGLFAFLFIFGVSSILNLPILHKITLVLANVATFAILIIFQPELRLALSKLSLKGKKHKEMTEFERFLDQLCNSIHRLSDKRTGALIVMENEDSLGEYANKAVTLGAQFSSELLESIFATTTPLHDGAVILRGKTIVAAAVILPLSEDSSQLGRSMGTRHRAALGLSQQTDALIIVISEESGKISVAREGIITRGIKLDRFKGILRSVFTPPTEKEVRGSFKLTEWLKQ